MFLREDVWLCQVKTEDAVALTEIRRKAWEAAYRGIYPDAIIDEFDYEMHANKFRRQIRLGSL